MNVPIYLIVHCLIELNRIVIYSIVQNPNTPFLTFNQKAIQHLVSYLVANSNSKRYSALIPFSGKQSCSTYLHRPIRKFIITNKTFIDFIQILLLKAMVWFFSPLLLFIEQRCFKNNITKSVNILFILNFNIDLQKHVMHGDRYWLFTWKWN